MNFEPSQRTVALSNELSTFMTGRVEPAEEIYEREMAELGDPHAHPPIIEALKAQARERGLWNLFMPHRSSWIPEPLSTLEYAPLAELMGRSPLAPEACNASAPDTGNMEVLSLFGTPAQQEQWLVPLLEGAIRSAFAMTEPAVASSDANNISLEMRRDGRDLLLNGRKWWITGAANPRCAVLIVMGVSDPDAPPHRRHSMVLVPTDTPGVTIVRSMSVFGYEDREGHAEILFEDARVPADNVIGDLGAGFAIAQARLGPGRVHHCMRSLGVAERSLELLCQRAHERHTFGRSLAEHGVIQEWVARARMSLDQARLYVLYTAWLIDTVGPKAARTEIAAIKALVPSICGEVVDKAIQTYGAAGIGPDTPLARSWAQLRTLRIADGPDEVHLRTVARRELDKWKR